MSATGNSVDNLLTGNDGNNQLNGRVGADTMTGGAGNDTYVVDSLGDVVNEVAGAGTDLVQSSVSFSLAGRHIENLQLNGSAAINGTGNSLGNVMTGNANNNLLDGGSGADTMTGGAGNDSFVVDNVGDVVSEISNGGTDLVQSSVSYSLAGLQIENLTLTGSGHNNATGNGLANVLVGNGGNNLLNGGAGIDTMAGGAGDDTYVVDAAGDVVVEAADGGTDTVSASISYILAAQLERLELTGTAANATGNAANNTLVGNSGHNLLSGGAGADTMLGGGGSDTYIVAESGDLVIEDPGSGTDWVQSSVSYSLVTNVEHLALTGAASINGTGNALGNHLDGNASANRLDGAGGADTMAGAGGDDTYVVDHAGDVVIESSGNGSDHVMAGVSYVLQAEIEHLQLTGGAAINATGNAGGNSITGNSGNNQIDGGGGGDTMAGGLGNDTYVVDLAGDLVVEASGAGVDTVLASANFILGSGLENLVLTGTAAINATGNDLDNRLTGNSGNNHLDGKLGIDTLVGGAGDDTYIVDNSSDVVTEAADEGVDTVQAGTSYSLLGSAVENLTLTTAFIATVSATGNALDNVLRGNASHDLLDGRGGSDTMYGGGGNDTFVVTNAGDVVNELAGEGLDTVTSSLSFALAGSAEQVENLVLTGTAAINASGNAMANRLVGNTGANVLTGGAGDDTYVVDLGDTVVEAAGAGTDTIQMQTGASFSLVGLDTVENLVLASGYHDANATGNALANVLTGNEGSNLLDGGLGADTMIGGGNDTYVVDDDGDVIQHNPVYGSGTVLSSISYVLGGSLTNLTLTGTGDINATGNFTHGTIIGNSGNNRIDGGGGRDSMAGGAGDDTYFVNDPSGDSVLEHSGEGIDTIESYGSPLGLLAQHVENLVLGAGATDGSGNNLNNVLTGNAHGNRLDGREGGDTLIGGAGDDDYIVDDAGDVIIEAAGDDYDAVMSTISFSLVGTQLEYVYLWGNAAIDATGNSAANLLYGNSAANYLDGRLGADTMVGGDGDDTYVVSEAGDVIAEDYSDGIDTVISSISYSLIRSDPDDGSVLENLTLTGSAAINGTGNAEDNILIGNGAGNLLDGRDNDDLLDGGAGADTLVGGNGNDTYVVDNVNDVVTEAAAAGLDEVRSSISYTLGTTLENLILTGTSAINGTGNETDNQLTGNAGNNVLNGGAGADMISGGAGADTMSGGTGDDWYVVDNVNDIVVEGSDGLDGVSSSVSYVLGATVEALELVGGDAINATGNGGGNNMVGGDGDNVLDGRGGDDILGAGDGSDTLIGGSGSDQFFFMLFHATGQADAQRDTITDFHHAEGDLIDLSLMDAVAATAGDDAFTYISSASFSGTDASGQLRYSGGVLYASTDADADAEFSVGLTGTPALVVADLVL
ncbi:MAG TPA: hypothetical protein VLI06_05020 [Solimonas sp.]|nr:hypothetical protein [Solimonas sp.]